MLKDEQTIYKSPTVKVVETKMRSIICQSGNSSIIEQVLSENDFVDEEDLVDLK